MSRRDDFDDGWQSPGQAQPKRRKDNVPPPPHHNGGKAKRFITYADYAAFFGVKVDTVRHWVAKGKFGPSDLASVIRFWQQRQG